MRPATRTKESADIYVYLPALSGAEGNGEPLTVYKQGTTYFAHADHLSVRVTTDAGRGGVAHAFRPE